MSNSTAWKGDNYKFVGHEFNYSYKNMLDSAALLRVVGQRTTNSIDYELSGGAGYSELQPYDGNLFEGAQKRGFKTILTPTEYTQSDVIKYKQAINDRTGTCQRIGKMLGDSAAMTVYLHVLRMFGNAFNSAYTYGDGKTWAATDHPIASKADGTGRTRVADPDAGVYSNRITDLLDVDAIDKARGMANRFVTPSGLPMICNHNILLVSPELEATAKKLLGENAKYKPTKDPASANNAASSIVDMQYIVVGGGKDGFSEKQWAVCDAKLMLDTALLVYTTLPKVFNSEMDNPLLDRYTAYVDFATGAGDGRGIIFSDGTGT